MTSELTQAQQAFIDAIARNTEGLTAVSTGLCPGCPECAFDYCLPQDAFDASYEVGMPNEPHFSRQPCDLCGSSLGGDREVWHALDADGELVHGDGVCGACVDYLANGNLPKDWEG